MCFFRTALLLCKPCSTRKQEKLAWRQDARTSPMVELTGFLAYKCNVQRDGAQLWPEPDHPPSGELVEKWREAAKKSRCYDIASVGWLCHTPLF